jgi:metal-responsive CopG/Arc/MetJ family transcriptional regulator
MNWSGDQTQHRARLSASGKAFFETDAGQARKLEIAANNKVDERIIGAFTKGRETIKEMRESDKLSMSRADYLLKWSPGFTADISQIGNAKIRELRQADKLSMTPVEYKEKWSGTYRNANAKYATYDLNVIKDHLSNIVYPKITDGEIRIAAATVYPDLKNKFDSLIRRNGYTSISEFMVRNFDGMSTTRTMKVANPAATNHKVISVVYRQEKMDVGTLTVDGDNLYHDYHNFALTAGVFVMNSKGTEITTLQGSNSLINSDFIEYFQNKLYQSLNVPIGRLKPETGFSLGRSNEVTREELKFGKFIARLRVKFSSIFSDLLRIQLIAKGLIRADEWDDIKSKIRFDFVRDNHFTELKNAELITNRMNTLSLVDPFVGRYFSREWVQKNVLMLDDEEVVDMDKQMKAEGADAIPPPDGGIMPQGQPASPWPDYQQSGAAAAAPQEQPTEGPGRAAQ